MTSFFFFYRPLWSPECRTGSASLTMLRGSSTRAVRACNRISFGAKGPGGAGAGRAARGAAAGPRAQGGEAAAQGPRPGHKASANSVLDQGLKRRGSAAGPPALAARPVAEQRCLRPPAPLRALSEGPQHCRLHAPARRLPGGRGLCRGRVGEPAALGGRDLDGHWAPHCLGVPERPDTPLQVTLPPVRGERPHDGILGRPHGEAPPGLTGHPRGGLGGVPVPRPSRRSERRGRVCAVDVLDPVELVKGLSRPAVPQPRARICAPFRRGRRRGPPLAQVTAHAEQEGGSAALGRVSASAVSDVCRLGRGHARRVR